MKKITMFLSSILFSTALVGNVLYADNPNAWDYNVFTTGSIGTSSNPYSSDFEGITGSVGNVYLSNFGLNTSNTPASAPYALYSGGSVSLNSAQLYNGGVTAQGGISSTNSTIFGNVSSGGSLSGSGGSISGSVSVAGSNSSSISIGGSVSQGAAYSAPVNLNNVASYFQNAASYWGGLPATASATNSYGDIVVSNLSSGRNIVNISYSSLTASGVYGISLTGSSSSWVVINVTNIPSTANLQFLTISLNGGITTSDVLLNFGTSNSSITINGGSFSILAPDANIVYNSGALNGQLVADNLTGSGQVNSGNNFVGYQDDQNLNTQVPEPSTYALLGSMLILGGLTQRRRLVTIASK